MLLPIHPIDAPSGRLHAALPAVHSDLERALGVMVSVFAVESGISVHVAGDAPASAAAVSRAATTHMASRDRDILAVPVLSEEGVVAVLTVRDPSRDPNLAAQLTELALHHIDVAVSGSESDPYRVGLDDTTDPRLRILAEAPDVAVVVVDTDGEVVWTNRHAERVVGSRPGDLVGRRAWTPAPAATPTPTPTPAPAAAAAPADPTPAVDGPAPTPRTPLSPTPASFRRPLPTDRPLRILVAEDNPVNQKVTTALIERLGHTITVVDDGHDVLDALDRAAFDLVFLDLRMPRMSGLETAAEIVERFGSQRPTVIALTASATPGDRRRCLEAGMDAFVTKPITLDGLRQVLDAAVAGGEIASGSVFGDPIYTAPIARGPIARGPMIAQPAVDRNRVPV